jgi:hypothetical protein
MSDMPAGTSVASPTPISVRATTSDRKPVASPHENVASEKTITPTMITVTLLRASMILPIGSAMSE